MNQLDKHLFFTSYQKTLRYLVTHPSGQHEEKDISQATGVSRAGVNFALRELVKDGLAQAEKRGRTSLYSVDLTKPLIRQIKVLINLIDIEPLILLLQDVSEKIILFGSSSTGTNIEESDIDFFILANKPKAVRDIINESLLAEKIQPVIQKPIDYLTLEKKDPVFYNEVSRGLVLWEKKQ